MYGTTFAGGDSKVGTIFRLAPHGGGQWTEEIVHSFNNDGQDGTGPDASVIFDSTGNLYGTTSAGGSSRFGGGCGGSGCGTVFEITP